MEKLSVRNRHFHESKHNWKLVLLSFHIKVPQQTKSIENHKQIFLKFTHFNALLLENEYFIHCHTTTIVRFIPATCKVGKS